jgi:pSer/pThr/pTyr-binding forkhead associated (FHA) protein
MMDNLEEGQIVQDQSLGGSGDFYDPELEWPGDDSAGPSQNYLRSGQPVFRFVVLRSSILPKKQKIAVVDAYPEVQIGRDIQPEGSTTPRIRLKEMEVSKFHATAYWDGARKEWNLVDMGSMHGTYLRSGPVTSDSTTSGTRLSQARAASMPRRLRHSDQMTVGGTTFEVHIHDNQRPCQHCTIFGEEEIPLFPPPKKTAIKRTRDVAEIDFGTSASSNSLAVDRNPKRALNTLKRSLLTRHDASQHSSAPISPVSVEKQPEYVDRAARRRLLHPASRPDTPGVASIHPLASRHTPPLIATEPPVPKPAVSAPPAPLPSTNIGHRLLLQQGWAPGSALGVSIDPTEGRVGLIDPLEVKSSQNRAGLGMKPPPTAAELDAPTPQLSWKEKEKFKRFNALR